MKTLIRLSITALLFTACNTSNERADAYGNFEAIETVVSSEVNGKILKLIINEGQNLKKGDVIGLIDTTQLSLKKQQVIAQKKAVSTKTNSILSQIDVIKEQKKKLVFEKERINNLLKDGAATQKQLDDINSQTDVLDKQIESIKVQNSTVFNELKAMEKQIEQIDDQINISILKSPVTGTVLEKYVEQYEIAIMGKPMYKIANLSKLELRVYISGDQLSKIKLGQEVSVLIDKNAKENKELKGKITWISEQSEFTPKIIQTKEERVNLVYAVKISVKNDGSLKIGMPGEVLLKPFTAK